MELTIAQWISVGLILSAVVVGVWYVFKNWRNVLIGGIVLGILIIHGWLCWTFPNVMLGINLTLGCGLMLRIGRKWNSMEHDMKVKWLYTFLYVICCFLMQWFEVVK